LLVITCACSHEPGPPMAKDSEPAFPPIATQAAIPPQGDSDPQDLEPVETRRSYGARDPDPLLNDVDAEFSMVSMPSFSPAYAVALVFDGADKPGEKFSDGAWRIHFVAEAPAGMRRLAKHEDPRRSADAGIDAASALKLQHAWESVVRRARYPRPRYVDGPDGERWESFRVGLDGTTYRFESGQYCGTTWSPKAELTWGIVELGDELRRYALLDETKRPAQLARCLELARKLQEAAEKRPW